MDERQCWFCNKPIEACQWAILHIPVDDPDRTKKWFHSKCYMKHIGDHLEEMKREECEVW